MALVSIITCVVFGLHGKVDSQAIVVESGALFTAIRCPDSSETFCVGDSPSETHSSISKGQCSNACNRLGWNWFNFIADESSAPRGIGTCQLFATKPQNLTKGSACIAYEEASAALANIAAELICRSVGIKSKTLTIDHVLTGNRPVQAAALLDDQLFVTRIGSREVSVYNTTSFQLQHQLTFVGLGYELTGLATCAANNYLYIADYTYSQVHRINLPVVDVPTRITWNVPTGLQALSVNSARNLLVANGIYKLVQEYTPTGSLIGNISVNNALFQALELSSGMIAFSQRGPTVYGVSIMSRNSSIKHTYGNWPASSGVGQMRDPCGLAVDARGYIFVTDYGNHRLLVLNPFVTDVRQLLLPVSTALQNPVPVVLDQSRGRLYVGEWGGQNRLLVFGNVTNAEALFVY